MLGKRKRPDLAVAAPSGYHLQNLSEIVRLHREDVDFRVARLALPPVLVEELSIKEARSRCPGAFTR